MNQQLTTNERRIIGVLLEKEVTTPEQYPLSLNALTNACNQKSNREPVMDLDESTIRATTQQLENRGLVRSDNYKSRVTKYFHRFCNTEFGELKLTDQQKAVITELLLRGPQMPGELRARASRMAKFADVSQLESVLQTLIEHEQGPLVVKLEREPGKRESRYADTFGELDKLPVNKLTERTDSQTSKDDQVAALKATIEELRRENSELRDQIEQLKQIDDEIL